MGRSLLYSRQSYDLIKHVKKIIVATTCNQHNLIMENTVNEYKRNEALRKEGYKNSQKLAKLLGFGSATISRWECGFSP